MGGVSANSANVNFAFDLALQAARDLAELAGVVNDKHYAWHTEAVKAEDGWEGGHQTTFHANLSTLGTDAESISAALVTLADLFATKWAEARGEQDRINFARWVQAQKDDDWWGEDVVDFFHEEDHGEPPGNPEVPSAPDYSPTRDPIHPEYENRVNA